MTTEITRILRLKPTVLDRTGLCRSTIYRLMADGNFPKSVSLGSRSIGFFERDIEAWLGSRAPKTPTSNTPTSAAKTVVTHG